MAVVGAESTGKTTLARALAERAAQATGWRVAWIDEHLRGWCEAQGRTPRREEQQAIALAQQARIDAAAATHDLVVADTTALMTALYSEWVFGDTSLTAWAMQLQRGFALTLLTRPDLPWEADGLQRDGPQVQAPLDARLQAWLAQGGVRWVSIQGQGNLRLERAWEALQTCITEASNL